MSIDLGFGFQIGSHQQANVDEPVPPVSWENWVQIPDVGTHCMEEVGKFAVDQFNLEYGNNLIFKSIYEGWYWEINYDTLQYCLHLNAIDCLGRPLSYEAIVLEETTLTERIWKLISFKRI